MRWDQPLKSGRVFGKRQHWLRAVVSLGFVLGLSSPAPEIAQADVVGTGARKSNLTCVQAVRAYITKKDPTVDDVVGHFSLASVYLYFGQPYYEVGWVREKFNSEEAPYSRVFWSSSYQGKHVTGVEPGADWRYGIVLDPIDNLAYCWWPGGDGEVPWYGGYGTEVTFNGEVLGHPDCDVPGVTCSRCEFTQTEYGKAGDSQYTSAPPLVPFWSTGFTDEFGSEATSTGVEIWDKDPQQQ